MILILPYFMGLCWNKYTTQIKCCRKLFTTYLCMPWQCLGPLFYILYWMLTWEFSSCYQYTRNNPDIWKFLFSILSQKFNFFWCPYAWKRLILNGKYSFEQEIQKYFTNTKDSRTRDIAGRYVYFWNFSEREKTRDL